MAGRGSKRGGYQRAKKAHKVRRIMSERGRVRAPVARATYRRQRDPHGTYQLR
jgi:hypothetical protein